MYNIGKFHTTMLITLLTAVVLRKSKEGRLQCPLEDKGFNNVLVVSALHIGLRVRVLPNN